MKNNFDIDVLIATGKLEKEEKFWMSKLSGELLVSRFPADSIKNVADKTARNIIKKTVPGEIYKNLLKISNNSDERLHMILAAALSILLCKYTGNEDIIIGSPIYRQSNTGEFINNMLTLRSSLNEDMTFKELLLQMRQTIYEAVEHQNYPVERLYSRLNCSLQSTGDYLFDSIVFVEGVHDSKYVELVEVGTKFIFTEKNGELHLTLDYDGRLYKRDTADRIIEGLFNLMDSGCSNVNTLISHMECISQQDRDILLYDFNNTVRDFNLDMTISQLFEEQAEKTPDNIAIRFMAGSHDIYSALASKDISADTYRRLARCCFRQNPFLHRFQPDLPKAFKKILKEYEQDDMVLLKTHCHNYVAVSSDVIAVLEKFDGETNLKSVLEGINSKGIRVKVCSITLNFRGEFTVSGKVETELKDKTRDGIAFIRALYNANLVTVERVSSRNRKVDFKPQSSRPSDQDSSSHSLKEDMYASGESVLLLGDTVGTATTGILYIASYLRRYGIKAFCRWNDTCEDTAFFRNSLELLLQELKPRIVGISMKWFPHMARVLEMCKIIKAYSSEIKIVIGGNTAAYFSDSLINYEFIDYIILGDGEEPMLKICQGADYIPNCIYRSGDNILNNPITYIQDRDNSGEIYLSHLEEIFIAGLDPFYARYFYIYTGKGCLMNCFYCAGCKTVQQKDFGRSKPFFRDMESVRKDIIEAKKYTSTLMFDFDIQSFDMTDYYKSIFRDIDLSEHFCWIYLWKLPSRELMDLMVNTFKYVYIHVDICSLSERHRKQLAEMKVVKPQPSDKELISFFDRCGNYDNLEITLNLISGLPCFTAEDMEESERTARFLSEKYMFIKSLDWGRLHAQPGAPLVQECGQYDMYTTASSFNEYLHFSELNMKEKRYPDLETINYPFIYYKDDVINSDITRHYLTVSSIFKEAGRHKKNGIYEELTYRELNNGANCMANFLRKKGIKPNSVVGIILDRSVETVTAIMGVLKAGGTYLPVDARYPEERIKFILEDSGADVIIFSEKSTDEVFVSVLKKDKSAEWTLFSLPEHSRSERVSHIMEADAENNIAFSNPDNVNNGDDTAYIIYTSGTTGTPKGVAVKHKGISNTIQWRKNEYALDGRDRVLQLFSHTFDGFLTSFFTAVASGAAAVFLNEENSRNPIEIANCIVAEKITHFIAVPALYSSILDVLDGKRVDSLRIVTLAGEKVHYSLVEKSKAQIGKLELVNEYGPTECSVASTVLRNMQNADIVTIGRPIANTRIYILDKNQCPQPLGAAGEICIGGIGVAKGYLNNKLLTEDKFVPDPFVPCEKMYKSGDLARYLPNGEIEYIGRADRQVKIRGYRIETDEIRNRILDISGIKDAVVTAAEDGTGEVCLRAYFVSGTKMTIPDIREHLYNVLPEYMVPGFICQIDKIPLTTTGKIDVKALEQYKYLESEEEKNTDEPFSETEEKLICIWKEVLGIQKVGRNSNFFDLGGHSLKAVTLIFKIQGEFGVEVRLSDVFNRRTLQSLAQYIDECEKAARLSIQPIGESDYYPVSSAQKRLYVINQLEDSHTGYNMLGAFILEGKLQYERIDGGFKLLAERHEALRTSFKVTGGEPVQIIDKNIEFKLDYIDPGIELNPEKEQDAEKINELLNSFAKPFILNKAPLFRAALIVLGYDRHLLAFDMHHIISDGVTMSILFKEFIALYKGLSLPELPVQYKDFAVWQNRLLNSDYLKKQKEYWLDMLKGHIPVLEMPCDYPRPALQSFEGEGITFESSRELNEKLHKLAGNTETTMFMLLFAAYNALLSRYTQQEDIIVGTPVAGRNHEELQNIMGIFVNTLALRSFPQKQKPFIEYLKEVKDLSLNSFENQEYQFEELVGTLGLKRDMSRNPLFDTMFTLQNIDMVRGGIEGLKFSNYEIKSKTTIFDFTLDAVELGDTVKFSLHYCTRLFKHGTMERFVKHFLNILESIVKDPYKKIIDLEILSAEERDQILNEFNKNLGENTDDGTFVEMFQKQAGTAPHRTAVICGDREMTYRELNSAANRLGHLLKEKGMGRDVIGAVMLERSPEFLTGIIGIFKAGGAYLPLEHKYPQKRIISMLEDSKAKVLLTRSELIKDMPFTALQGLAAAVPQVAGGCPQISRTPELPGSKPGAPEIGPGAPEVQGDAEHLRPETDRVLNNGKNSALKFLLLDLSSCFPDENSGLPEVIRDSGVMGELPGDPYALNSLEEKYAGRVQVKTAGANTAFNSYRQLKLLIEEYEPDVIAAAAPVYCKDFLHKTVSVLRQWGVKVPVISAGAYAANEYALLLKDGNIDLAVIGEGEAAIAGLAGRMLDNDKKLPGEKILGGIAGLAYIPEKEKCKPGAFAREMLMLDHMDGELSRQPEENPEKTASPEDLAYVIYTSGSTGIPKGAMIEHRGMLNHILAEVEQLHITGDSVIAQNASQCFDISVWQFLAALTAGGKTAIYADDLILEPGRFIKQIIKDGVSILEVVPTYLTLMLGILAENPAEFKALKYIMPTGEAVTANLIKKWLELYPEVKVVNAYGPAEASDDITQYIMDGIPENEIVPIGKPIRNTRIYITDKEMNLCPVGIAGEICVSGTGVGRGYINDSEKTREVFGCDPFIGRPGVRLYKTGDMGRWLPDGNIEFIGRRDNQVKIRGFRIETGEIESKLCTYEGIKQSIVTDITDEGENRYLCAYFTASEREVAVADLRRHLAQSLPDYMIPSRFMQLEEMPVTHNGKIDRRALPEPEIKETGQVGNELPRNHIEKRLAEIWQEVLDVKKVSIKDNFFELGGDSIKAIQVSSRLNKYKMKLEIRAIFQHPQICELSEYIKTGKKDISQKPVEGEVELTPEQSWFFEQQFTDSHHYNQSVMLYRRQGFEDETVRKVFTKIAGHHDALRMVYRNEGGRIVQYNRSIDCEMLEMEVAEICDGDIAARIVEEANRIQGSIDLSRGPLVKLGLFKTGEGDHLLIVIHHLVVDGVSWRIIFEDFAAGYKQALEGKEIELMLKTDSFMEWAGKLREYADGREIQKEKEYWKAVESNCILPLPKDKISRNSRIAESRDVHVSLPEKETEILLKNVNKAYNTEINDILLTALGLAINEWAGADRVLINLEGHGREEIIEEVDITRTVGWFTSEYPVLLDMTNYRDLSYLIKTIKEDLRHIPNKGIGYGILKYLTPEEKKKDIQFKLKPEISFNYLGQFDEDIDIELFSASNYSAGNSISRNNERKFSFDINGMVARGRLTLSFNYSGNEYYEETVQKLADSYKRILVDIINHCAGKEEAELSPSDFGDSDLSLEELEDIEEIMRL